MLNLSNYIDMTIAMQCTLNKYGFALDSVYLIAADKEEMKMKKTEKADNNRPLDVEDLTMEQIEKANGGAEINTVAFNGSNFNSADIKNSCDRSGSIK